jgi:hypothetical protein
MEKKMNMTALQGNAFLVSTSGENNVGGVAKQVWRELTGSLAGMLGEPAEWLRRYFSHCLERDIDMRQTLYIVQAQVAFIFAALPADCHLALRAAFGLWFVWSLKACRRSLMVKD